MQIKKLLGSVLALALVASVSQANAELLKNFKFGGSVEVSAQSSRGVEAFAKNITPGGALDNTKAFQDRAGDAQTRIMLNMDWDLLDDVHAKVSLSKNNRVYGANGDSAARNGAENLDTLQTQVFIDQGYFKIDKVFGLLDMTFGRQFYGEPGDLIAYFGPKNEEYGMNITAIDGVRLDWAGEKAYFTGVAFTPRQGIALGTPDPLNGSRVDGRGFIFGNKGHENIDGKVYLWNVARHGALVPGAAGTQAKNDNLYIVGFKAKAKFGGAYASFEAAHNFGDYRYNAVAAAASGNSGRYGGTAILINGGMKADVEQIGTFNPWAEFGYGSGDGDATATDHVNRNFQAIATDYRPGAIYGRFNANNAGGQTFGSVVAGIGGGAATAGNGLQNRIIWGFGLKATPKAVEKLTAGVQFYDFKFQTLGPGNAANSGNRHIGSEIDVTGEWKHSENVSLKGTVGNFQPGGYIRNVVNSVAVTPGTANLHTSAAWLSALDVSVKF